MFYFLLLILIFPLPSNIKKYPPGKKLSGSIRYFPLKLWDKSILRIDHNSYSQPTTSNCLAGPGLGLGQQSLHGFRHGPTSHRRSASDPSIALFFL